MFRENKVNIIAAYMAPSVAKSSGATASDVWDPWVIVFNGESFYLPVGISLVLFKRRYEYFY